MDAELEKILNDLKPSHKPGLNMPISTLQPTISSLPMQRLTSDKLEDFVLQNASSIVSDGIDLIKDLKNNVSQAIDSNEIEALASTIKAVNGSLEILNKLNINNKKQSGMTRNISNSGNTAIFIGTREEALKQIKNKKDIDVKYTEFKEDDLTMLNVVNSKEEIVENLVKEIKEEKVNI